MFSTRALPFALGWALLTACAQEPTPADSGPSGPDAGDDPPASSCARDEDCEDGSFCTIERCRPGDPEADEGGCVVLAGSPCSSDELCNEPLDRCEPAECSGDPDADDDGHDSLACGGDDCDDSDPDRHPSNDEVCDAEGHDEDCVEDTVGARDEDGDGFVDDACCNGAVCGLDCDDATSSVSPTAAEQCNGVDDDCDEDVDESSDPPLCPGGVCTAGRCRFEGWDRTFGGSGPDFGTAATTDRYGNIYVVGVFSGAVRFGSTMETSNGGADAFVISFAPDGAYRWHRVFGGSADDQATSVAVGPDAVVYVAGYVDGPADLGSGSVPGTGLRGYLLALDGDGAYRWSVIAASSFRGVAVSSAGPLVAGTLTASEDLGGGPRDVTASTAGVVVQYGWDGGYVWDTVVDGESATHIDLEDVTADSDSIVFAGTFRLGGLSWEGTLHTNAGGADFFVISLEASSGTPSWSKIYRASGEVQLHGLTSGLHGEVYVGGAYGGEFDLGSGRSRTAPGTRAEGFVLALDDAGAHDWHQFLYGSADVFLLSVATGLDGSVYALGGFAGGSVDFGGGLRSATASKAFIVRYGADGLYRRDTTIDVGTSVNIRSMTVGPGDSTAYVGGFQAAVDLGSGERVSNGSFDAFVVRLGT
jgi:hypothetical protein